ncbi:MAG: MarR family transcriptional regulator, partial [Desulfobacterium sp.]|nr:MarR family transcriptional regulator [Desulfobacterium sp.]
QRLNEKFFDAGLEVTSEQWVVMVSLWNEDGLSQQALANLIRRSKVAVFKLIGGLEKKGLVMRTPDPNDGRSNRIFLTPRGKEIKAAMIRVAKDNLHDAARGVSDNELQLFKKVLRQLIINTGN